VESHCQESSPSGRRLSGGDCVRVLLVTDFFAPAWGYGGPPKLVLTISKQLASMGHEVAVLTTDALDERRFSASNYLPFEVIRARNASNSLAWQRKICVPILPRNAASTLREADIVHIFQLRSFLSLLAYLGTKLGEKPLVLSPLGGAPLVGSWHRIPKTAFDRLATPPIRRKVGAVLCQTNHEMQVSKSLVMDESRIHLVPLCVESDDCSSLPSKGEFIRKHPELREFDQIYVFLGRIHKYKGIEMLMRAFQQAFRDENNALVVAGKDEEGHLRFLQHRAASLGMQKKVFFPGAIYHQNKREAFVDAHAFVITPSIFEETSLAALEAAACGTPVLTTIQAEIPWLEQYSAGFMSEYDVDAISKNLVKMSRIVGNERVKMGLSARRLIDEHYSAQAVTKQIERVYLSLVER